METKLEYVLTHAHKAEMVSFMHSHPEHYEEAITLAISNKQPYAWRAAWLLWSCIDTNDFRLQKHIQKILDNIPNKSDGHQRELIKILMEMKLSEEQEGHLLDLCVSLWKQTNKKPSVRFTAFRYISEIARKYPDLYTEIVLLTQKRYLETLSPGVRRSILKMIKKNIGS